MLINFSRNTYNLEGEVFQEVLGKNEDGTPRKVPVTLRSVVSASLQVPIPGDEKMIPKEREVQFDLLMKIHKNPVVELDSEEITKIKQRVVKLGYNNLIIGQVLKMLEGKETGLELKEGAEDDCEDLNDTQVELEMKEPTPPPVEEIAEGDIKKEPDITI